MQITVSAGRKIYRRASGQLEESRDFFESQTIILPDESPDEVVMVHRIILMEKLEAAIDVHVLADGCASSEKLIEEAALRKSSFRMLKERYRVV